VLVVLDGMARNDAAIAARGESMRRSPGSPSIRARDTRSGSASIGCAQKPPQASSARVVCAVLASRDGWRAAFECRRSDLDS